MTVMDFYDPSEWASANFFPPSFLEFNLLKRQDSGTIAGVGVELVELGWLSGIGIASNPHTSSFILSSVSGGLNGF